MANADSEVAYGRRIGLTGGIATGKSTVARLLTERYGIPVLDADCFARDALAPGTQATLAVLDRYGAVVRAAQLSADAPAIDRQALAHIVFADPAERRWLEQLVHPIVRASFASGLRRLVGEPVVVLMIPLLFEAHLEGLCSETWVVDCGSEAEQIRRLRLRDAITAEAAASRLRAQMPMAEKLARADRVIHNIGEEAELLAQLERALALSG
jgi:dephospho-CoA kinase